MAKVTVRLYATARDLAGESMCVLEAEDMEELLALLSERYGERFASMLADRAVAEGAVMLLDGRNVPPGVSPAFGAEEEHEVAIFPPISGG